MKYCGMDNLRFIISSFPSPNYFSVVLDEMVAVGYISSNMKANAWRNMFLIQ